MIIPRDGLPGLAASVRPFIWAARALIAAGLPMSALASAPAPVRAAAQEAPRQVLFTGGLVVDGTGSPRRHADVLIGGGRISEIGPPGSIEAPPGTEIRDVSGLVVAPGFIDIHNHSTDRMWDRPLATTQIAQGITTLIVGADGSSPFPIDEYLVRIDTLAPTVNVGTYVGHGTVRWGAMQEDYSRPATELEIAHMARLVERGMMHGAFGFSSGLEYSMGLHSTTEELIALAKVAAEHGGHYATHMRDEEENLLEAVDEALAIGEAAGIAVHISHVKAGNASVWGAAPEVLRRMEAARERGLDVTADQYPYAAWQSGLSIIARSRAIDNPDSVAAGIEAAGGPGRLQIVAFNQEPSLNGLRLDEIARRKEMTPVETVLWINESGGAGVIGHTMSDEDVETFMQSPLVMTASDGGVGTAHPRGAGAFARVLGLYAREKGLLTLERAVQRGTSQPARRLGLTDRGTLREGAIADMAIFDWAGIIDRSTFDSGLRPAEGMVSVWVSGVEVWSGGEPTGARPGRALRRPGTDQSG